MSHPLPLIKKLEDRFLRAEPLPEFRVGDTVRVQVKIREGEKERLQAFEGVVIRRTGGGARSTFTVRKISYGVGVERVFAENSPNIASVEVLAKGKVHQARLYFLRNLSGKAARIKERGSDRALLEAVHAPAGEGGEAGEGGAAAPAGASNKKRGAHRKERARAESKPPEPKTKDKKKSRKAAKSKAAAARKTSKAEA